MKSKPNSVRTRPGKTKPNKNYLKLIEWSEEDQCFIGRVPGLALGGVHGRDEKKVYEELCTLVDEWIAIHGEDNVPLPAATAGKSYSGKFNLRVGEELHEKLTLESLKVGESLNSYVVRVLQNEVGNPGPK
jgi:predicted HicB family RNase H-like nuclease